MFDNIRRYMPWLKKGTVWIQHDGARPHCGHNTEEWLSVEGSKKGWDMCLFHQPAQSPDLNVNDLGFFHSLKVQSRKIRGKDCNIDDMIIRVRRAWREYCGETLDNIWGHLFGCYEAILVAGGDSVYPKPHKGYRKCKKTSSDAYLEVDVSLCKRANVHLVDTVPPAKRQKKE